ncbi:MAG: hypothetical protein ACRC62_09405 [Microcoleus sp.]
MIPIRAIALELLYRLRSNSVADTQQQLEPFDRLLAKVPNSNRINFNI